MQDMKDYIQKSELLKAIAHPVRLCIVRGLLNNECNVTKMQECLNLPQSTVSQHLAKLKSAGIIEGERNGLEICYKVVNEQVKDIIKLMF
ncbi:metalloregulator ArsR/SmtB family transcription factor [Sporomusa sp.]|uniref:ArsR/SmtB family transcription factor n=1 Tax=Sporomusa sp. TaxID=2078658 RepID=UPI002D16D3B6|nr:metalloregulator ArsR/SmtB family transcription factor [Sporomusa sp.]HWR41772.1 metalloregulator ArsR/SmtB family transcription factor [Sporomusa sp.]